MAGDSKQTGLWDGADVYIAPENTTGPSTLTAEWPVAWDAVGLLSGDDGIVESRDSDSNENYAWGGILYRKTVSNQKRTFKFSALEDNDVVFNIVNPGSTRTSAAGVRTSTVKTPKTQRFAVGFEVRDGDRIKRRYALSASVDDLSDITESETDPTVYEITVVIYPESDGTLYHTIETDPDFVAGGSGS